MLDCKETMADDAVSQRNASRCAALVKLARAYDSNMQHHAAAFCYTQALRSVLPDAEDHNSPLADRGPAVLVYHIGLQCLQIGSCSKALYCFQKASVVLSDSYLLHLRLAECTVELSCGANRHTNEDSSSSSSNSNSNSSSNNKKSAIDRRPSFDASNLASRQKLHNEAAQSLELSAKLLTAQSHACQQSIAQQHQIQSDKLQMLLLIAVLAVASDGMRGNEANDRNGIQLLNSLQETSMHCAPSAASAALDSARPLSAGNNTVTATDMAAGSGPAASSAVSESAYDAGCNIAMQNCETVLQALSSSTSNKRSESEPESATAVRPAAISDIRQSAVAHVISAAIHLQRNHLELAAAHVEAARTTIANAGSTLQHSLIKCTAETLGFLSCISSGEASNLRRVLQGI